MTEAEIKQHKADIDKLSQRQMAAIQRFAATGHTYFGPELYRYFRSRFNEKGGMTPKISKGIGW